MTEFRVGSATDVGQVRSINQDSILVAPEVPLFGVADGMGGHQGGEVASALAVEIVGEGLGEDRSTLDTLLDKVREANARIFARSAEEASLRGMGTTFVAVALVRTDDPDADVAGDDGAADGASPAEDTADTADTADAADEEEVAWINVGDSRVYLLRDGELRQLSRDHSLVEDLRRGGQLTDAEAAVHPQRNILTRALGIDRTVDVDAGAVLPFLGDRFLLCSDGLYNEVTPDVIVEQLTTIDDLDQAARELVRLANEGGGRDNISCVIVEVTDDDGRAERAAEAAAAHAAAVAERAAVEGDGEGGDEAGDDEDRVDTVEMPAASPDGPEPGTAAATGLVPDDDATPPHGSPLPLPPAADDPTDTGDGPGAVPAEGPFPTPADPGFPTDDGPSGPSGADGTNDTNGTNGPEDDDDLPFDRPSDDLYSDMDRAGGRHWAFTAAAVVVVLALLLGGLYAAANWWAGRTYHLAADDSEVVIYRGPSGGFLFISPSVSERMRVNVDELPDDAQAAVAAEREFGSRAKARSFVNNAKTDAERERREAEAEREATTTTTTTTTTTEAGESSEPLENEGSEPAEEKDADTTDGGG